MDCKDLMICDFVKHNGVIKIVDAVYLYSVSVHDPSEEWSISEAKTYPVDDIEPIELTKDILVKNGFQLEQKIEDDCLTYRCGNFHLFYYPDGTGLYSYNSQIVIGSVHQLQHLLRLCGVEKELAI